MSTNAIEIGKGFDVGGEDLAPELMLDHMHKLRAKFRPRCEIEVEIDRLRRIENGRRAINENPFVVGIRSCIGAWSAAEWTY